MSLFLLLALLILMFPLGVFIVWLGDKIFNKKDN